MARNKLTISFDGFEGNHGKAGSCNSRHERVTERALQSLMMWLHLTLKSDCTASFNRSDRAITKSEKRLNGKRTKAYIKVGFNISKGGLASIFLMYGTPRMQPDKKLYNSIYGSSTKKK